MALVDYFLKIDGIKGESKDHKHAEEIQIESFSFGASQAGTSTLGTGMGAGKVQMQDFHFVMKVQKASPLLFLNCANGAHIKNAILTCRKAGKEQQEYLKWTFEDLLVSSYQTGGGSGETVPTDQISFNYTKIKVEYKEQKPDGSLGAAVTAGYDLKANKQL